MIAPDKIPALYNKHGSLKNIARKLDVSFGAVERAYHKAVEQGLMVHVAGGRKPHTHTKLVGTKQRAKALKTIRKRHKAYILTCAQNNTLAHEATWENLKALAEYTGAEIYVSTFLYSKRGLGQRNDKAQLTGAPRDVDDIWFDPAITPYINNRRIEIAKGLVYCGELNILPTAQRPLSGLEVYTGRASMIVPHVKQELESVATLGGSGAKLNYSTGTITQRNYIQRKEGFKGEFYHTYGGLFVEVDDDGHWWVRQLNADSEGTIHDLDLKVEHGKITEGHRVEAITFGDVHVANIDEEVRAATWDEGGMVDVLRPRFQFVHDVLDMYSRSHHTKKDPYKVFKRFCQEQDNVQAEVEQAADFLAEIKRDDCQTVVINSNHDRHLGRWLAENDGRFDPVNAFFWSWLNAQTIDYQFTHDGNEPDHFKLAIERMRPNFEADNNVYFLPSDHSFVLCPKFGGGIEAGMHGDLGPNGARGSIGYFAKFGRRSNVGHSHTTGIRGGAFQTGTNSKLRLEYVHGPSSHSHSDIITHENGKRQIVTLFNGKWRA